MPRILFLIFLFVNPQVFSQTLYKLDQSKSVQYFGDEIPIPFSFGINSAQIQTLDLTHDGIEEWVVWDINSRQLQVFQKTGSDFNLLPELAYFFPEDINGYFILADFNQDGRKDLFTSTALGIKAYRNTSQGSDISWTLAQNFLKLDGANNIPANNLDTPLLQDLDGDGDLDLVIFNFAQGDFLEFYKNTSMERKGIPDIDGFAFPETYWGDFTFCGCEEINFGTRCDGSPINFRLENPENQRIQHAGGHSILYQDFSGDGIFDLVVGRDECPILYYLENKGSNVAPQFSSFSNSLPDYGPLPEFPIYHVGNLIQEDLVVSSNTSEAAFSNEIDFRSSILKLSKEGTGPSPILQNQLLDLGENARPYFQGNSTFGSLFISSNLKKEGRILSQMAHFDFRDGKFVLNDTDLFRLSELGLLDLQFIDYTDASRKNHFQLAFGTKRENNVTRPILYRITSEGKTPFSIGGLNLRVGDHLEIFPYQNKDYLLVAAQNGSLTLYSLDLEKLSATRIESNFLGFRDNPANRNLTVTVQRKEKPDLYTVDQSGKIFWIRDFMNSVIREEVLVKIENQNLPLRLGRNTWMTLLNPNFSEVADLVLGTRGGGIVYLEAITEGTPSEGDFLAKVFPNPSSGPITVITSKTSTGRLISPLGQVILGEIEVPANREVKLQTQILPPGIYLLHLESEDREVLIKKVLVR